MRIDVRCGQFTFPEWAECKDFCEYLASRSNEPLDDEGHRYVWVQPGSDVACGLNMYVRDQKKYYELHRTSKGHHEVKLQDVQGIVEFNFFFVRYDTAAFAYTLYKGSCTGLAEFSKLIKRRFRAYKQDVCASGDKVTGFAEYTPLMTGQDWRKQIKSARRIYDVSMSTTVVSGNAVEFQERDLRRHIETITFNSESVVSRVAKGIVSRFDRRKPERASVRAMMDDDVVRSFVLGRNAHVLDTFDFNRVVLDDLKYKDFHKSSLMRAILQHKDEPVLSVRS